MTFMHLSLAALGSGCIAIPILLHLLMRQRPKHAIFPALRFVQKRQQANQRKLKVRHLLLLGLRCLAIASIALALARPFVPSHQFANSLLLGLFAFACLGCLGIAYVTATQSTERSKPLAMGFGIVGILLGVAAAFIGWRMRSSESPGLIGDSKAPAAVALIFDVSPRTGYQFQNQSRLDVAQELGIQLLREFPATSDIAVVDTANLSCSYAVDRAAAKSAIDSLETAFTTAPLPSVIRSAIDLVKSSDQSRREVYIFTDMRSPSWQVIGNLEIAERIKGEPPVLVCLIDVSAEKYNNFSLGI